MNQLGTDRKSVPIQVLSFRCDRFHKRKPSNGSSYPLTRSMPLAWSRHLEQTSVLDQRNAIGRRVKPAVLPLILLVAAM